MKKVLWRQRTIILSLLGLTVISPIIFIYRIGRLPQSSDETLGLVEDVSSIRHRADGFRLNSLKQERSDGRKEPAREILKELILIDPVVGGNRSADQVSINVENNGKSIGDPTKLSGKSFSSGGEGSVRYRNKTNSIQRLQPPANEKIRNMRDQLLMARAYLQFTPPNSNSRLVRELRLRIKDIKSIVSQVNKDSELSRSAMMKMRAMEVSLSRANRAYPDCSAMATKLRAMAYTTEDQLRAQRKQVSYLVDLATRTISKGLHCLSMKLTSQYFDLSPEDRQLPKKVKVKSRRLDLYHMAIFSDNILACSVVVNSAVSSFMDPSKLVVHVVTDPLTFPAMTMWFMMNPPRPASIHMTSTEEFDFLPVDFYSSQLQPGVNGRFYSPLSHLRFYLPQVFPFLRKVLLVDHDVVVRKDLTPLWRVDLKEKVNGAVETPLRLESFVDFSDPALAGQFDPKTTAWAFGMNIFDLDKWRQRGLTEVYQKFLQQKRPALKVGTLPLGLLTFYNETRLLPRRWLLGGLGQAPGDASKADVDSASVIHYDGSLKPWLEVGLGKYKALWNRYIDYNHPLFRECNIHD